MQINTHAAGFKRFSDLKQHELFIKFEDIRTKTEPNIFMKLDNSSVACIGYANKYSMPEHTFVFPISIDSIGIKKG